MIFKPMPPIFLFDGSAQLSDEDMSKLTAAGYLPIRVRSVDGVRILGATTSPGPIVATE